MDYFTKSCDDMLLVIKRKWWERVPWYITVTCSLLFQLIKVFYIYIYLAQCFGLVVCSFILSFVCYLQVRGRFFQTSCFLGERKNNFDLQSDVHYWYSVSASTGKGNTGTHQCIPRLNVWIIITDLAWFVNIIKAFKARHQ